MAYELPFEVYALVSCYLGDCENGDFFRKQSGNIFIKHERKGKTYNNGLLHSFNDQPAWILGYNKFWYKHGKIHRDGDQPAIIWNNSIQYWYQNGKIHRDEKPAEIRTDGTQFWYQHGKQHRDGDQPAVIFANGSQEWYHHGKRVILISKIEISSQVY